MTPMTSSVWLGITKRVMLLLIVLHFMTFRAQGGLHHYTPIKFKVFLVAVDYIKANYLVENSFNLLATH